MDKNFKHSYLRNHLRCRRLPSLFGIGMTSVIQPDIAPHPQMLSLGAADVFKLRIRIVKNFKIVKNVTNIKNIKI
jgi:hypothetical protein